MKTIEQYIENLLVKHGYATVTGLGGFVTQRQSAQIKDNTLVPPTTEIVFNPLLSHHDGLLAEQYMSDRGISYTEANDRIYSEIATIKQAIDTNGYHTLGRIGVLGKNSDGTITLTQSNPHILPQNIGLPAVRLTPITQPKTVTAQQPKRIQLTPAQIMQRVAVIITVLLLSWSIPTPISNYENQASVSFKTLTNIAAPAIIADTVAIKPDVQVEPTHYRYHLIVASLANEQQAQKYLTEQTSFDPSSLAVIKSNGRYRISAKGFNSYKEAINHADSVRATVPALAKAWILQSNQQLQINN